VNTYEGRATALILILTALILAGDWHQGWTMLALLTP
jgi:hypothetical protein